MLRRIVTVSLVLVAAACAAPEPAPPSAGGEVGSQVTPSLDATTLRITVAPSTTTLRTTVMPGMTEVIVDKPCELLTRDEQVELGLEPPGTPQRPPGFVCNWAGKDFSMVISTSHALPLAQIEAGRLGERVTIASRRAASMARGEGEFAGLCDLALDIVRVASARIVLSRYDKNSAAACLNAVKVASLIHFRLPGA